MAGALRERVIGNLARDTEILRYLDANNGYLDADDASTALQRNHSATAMRRERLRENNVA